jgi:hypothetical protein
MAKTLDVIQQKQIEEYQSQLNTTKAGLKDTQSKNKRNVGE